MARKALLALVLFGLGFVVAGATGAQPRPRDVVTALPPVLSGENIGIRVPAIPRKDGPVDGTLVVRVDGRWVEVRLRQATGSADD